MKTYSAKPADITRKWYLIDASKHPLGRISTQIAKLLTGKGKPTYTPHIDGGDYVVVINAEKLVATGNKYADKRYFRHSQYPGSLKTATLQEMVNKDPKKVVELSVKRMLADNKLRDQRLARLKIYSGPEHSNQAQNPKEIDIKEGK